MIKLQHLYYHYNFSVIDISEPLCYYTMVIYFLQLSRTTCRHTVLTGVMIMLQPTLYIQYIQFTTNTHITIPISNMYNSTIHHIGAIITTQKVCTISTNYHNTSRNSTTQKACTISTKYHNNMWKQYYTKLVYSQY
jgi:hypothetical protein